MRDRPHWTVSQYSVLLTVIGILLWLLSLLEFGPSTTFSGLIPETSIFVFVALGLFVIASIILWTSMEKHGMLLGLQLGLFILGLHLTPLLIYEWDQGYFYFYRWGHNVDYIVNEGHINPGLLGYHTFPGLFLLSATLVQVLGVQEVSAMLPIVPLFGQFAIMLPLYLFFRNTIEDSRSNLRWAGMLLVSIGMWTGIGFAPQTLGYLLFLTLLAALSVHPFIRHSVRVMGYQVKAVLTFACLTITHLLTSFAGLALAATFYVANRERRSNPVVIIACAFVAAWMMYGAIQVYEAQLPNFMSYILRFDTPATDIVRRTTETSDVHQARVMAQIVAAVVLVAIGVLGWLLTLRVKNRGFADKTVYSLAAAVLIIVVLLAGSYGGRELLERCFIFALPCIGYFGIKMLSYKATYAILGTLIVILIPIRCLIDYSPISSNNLSREYTAGLEFFNTYTDHGLVTGSDILYRVQYHEHGLYRYFPYEMLDQQDNQLVHAAALEKGDQHYVSISRHEAAFRDFNGHDPDFIPNIQVLLENTSNSDRVYENGDMRLYVAGGTQ
ncbi:MAG: hypothetical protein SVY53_09965 [Chloroflexota bacterium]|nr:hypothetical protein [Chloroflexota bacterium]